MYFCVCSLEVSSSHAGGFHSLCFREWKCFPVSLQCSAVRLSAGSGVQSLPLKAVHSVIFHKGFLMELGSLHLPVRRLLVWTLKDDWASLLHLREVAR